MQRTGLVMRSLRLPPKRRRACLSTLPSWPRVGTARDAHGAVTHLHVVWPTPTVTISQTMKTRTACSSSARNASDSATAAIHPRSSTRSARPLRGAARCLRWKAAAARALARGRAVVVAVAVALAVVVGVGGDPVRPSSALSSWGGEGA